MKGTKLRKRAAIVLGGAMYALFAAFGWQAEHYGESRIAQALLVSAALVLPAMALLRLLFLRGEKAAHRPGKYGGFSAKKAFAAMLACYAPMFLITFPGSFAYDVPFQLEQAFTGVYSAHHPLLHTLLMGACVRLGRLIGNINLGAALYTMIQMAGLAACFALACASIARQSGDRAAKRSALFFSLYPLHMMMAVNATKDVLFSGLFVLTLALLREALYIRPDGKRTARIALCGAGMLLLRNNALYAMAVWVVLAVILLRRRALRIMPAALLAIALGTGAGGALKAATSATDGDLSEMLSWPIQQMARARNLHGDLLEEEEKAAIDELMPGESWRLYDPTISDPVKFEFDTDRFLSDPGKYVQTYLSVAKKCPKAYFDALLMHTYSFLYPYGEYGVSGYYLQMGISDQYYDWCDFERISSASLLPRVLASLSWRFGAQGAMQIPVIGYLFNMGVIVWAMLYFVLRELYLGRWKSFAAALLPVLLWGTFLLGPVMAGRYIYPFVCCLPVLASHVRED
ncbi:MAG: hypothetical protein IJ313_13345 [Clostridia bacterium]|nr:hypothetical protein [Clostridia bacterium]